MGPPGAIQAYYAQSRLTPPKVRAFVAFLSETLAGSAWLSRVAAMP
jgi:DNA-binding transcriptional LysR family regulator